MEKITLSLDGLGCANCAAKIETRSKEIEGVKDLVLDFSRSKIYFEHEGENSDDIIEKIKEIVHHLEPDVVISPTASSVSRQMHTNSLQPSIKNHSKWAHHDRKALIRLGLSLVFFALGLILNSEAMRIASLLIAYVLSGHKVLIRSYRNIRRGEIFDENFLMSIATFGAIAIGEYPEAVAVMIFYEVGEYFQDLAVNKSKSAITSLLDIRPDRATYYRDGLWITDSPESVKIDDIIMVKPGERIPLDGLIIDGGSNLDTSALTGESIPQYRSNGDPVLSGSVALDGIMKIKVTAAYAESTVAKILALVENATAHKSPTEHFITKFARYYTPIVVALAVSIILIPTLFQGADTFDKWLYRGLIFLVISCPCALVVSVPLGFFSGLGNASKNGILIKGGNYLEAIQSVDTIVFDKTGTLTEGQFEVYKIEFDESQMNQLEFLKIAALAEYHSNHPIAKSILDYCGDIIDSNDLISVEEVGGKGIVANTLKGEILAGNERLFATKGITVPPATDSHTLINFALNNHYIGRIAIRDKVKPDAKTTIDALKKLGYELHLLTGDRKSTASALGEMLGIEGVHGELLPEDKYLLVNTMINNGKKVAFVGDGINDAPVLAGATVGISMGGIGSDAAIEASDIVLMTDEPSKILQTIAISRKTKQIVVQNIVFALSTKILIMILGTFGLSSMWMAIFADVGVALIAILNSMRALTYKPVV